MADALTYAHTDDVERVWIDHVTTGVAQADLARRRWLVENVARGLGAQDLRWKDSSRA
ncbi:hypothetical protein [Euzebya rosea]|uniref:hypothetical protein n=1 Tax=Euzebya rosea TaxID=2052804 RepID=UPI001300752E|nr:hypothetical protein [Euzebya rosea]